MSAPQTGAGDTDALDLPALYTTATNLQKSLKNNYDYNSPRYQESLKTAISTYEKCRELVDALSLFSKNEGIEDVASSELKYMLIDAHLASLILKIPIPTSSISVPQGRKLIILRAKQYYERFLRLCDSYDLIVKKEDQALYEALVVEQAGSADVALRGGLQGDPGQKREAKIRRYREEKELKATLERLENLSSSAGGEENTNIDEDVIRKLYTTHLSLTIMSSLQAIESILLELDILSQAPSTPPGSNLPGPASDTRLRARGEPTDSTYTDRLELPSLFTNNATGPILDGSGKPLRPFTLLDKRTELRQGVFRPGHNLPTMTIDEYLEEERRRGNIISGGGEKSGLKPEPDEDNYEKTDAETMKARQWDEFKEENRRGSGNTMNRG